MTPHPKAVVKAIRMRKPGPWIGLFEVVEMLKTATAGNRSRWARRHGVSPQYVNDVIHGRRLPGDKITQALGLEKALLWRVPGGVQL
jgi:hypothetical protein